jgi:hypothetical protein
VLCACLLILVIGSTRLSTLPTTDEPHFLIAAHSIAYDGDLDLSNNYDLFAKWTYGDRHVVEVNGVLLPFRDLGPSLMDVPVALACRVLHCSVSTFIYAMRFWVNLLWSLGATLLYMSLFSHTRSQVISGTIAILSCGLYPGILYGSSSMPDSYAYVLNCVVLSCWTALRERATLRAVLLSTALFLIPWMHVRFTFIPLFIIFSSIFLSSKLEHNRSRKSLYIDGIILTCVYAISIVIRTLVNINIYNNYLGGQSLLSSQVGIKITNIVSRLIIVLFDRYDGFLFVFPAFLVGVCGLIRSRGDRSIGLVLLGLAAFYVLLPGLASPADIYGTYAGGRYLLAALPMLWFGVGTYFGREWEAMKQVPAAGRFWTAVGRLGLPVSLLLLCAVPSLYAWQSDRFPVRHLLWGDLSNLLPNMAYGPPRGVLALLGTGSLAVVPFLGAWMVAALAALLGWGGSMLRLVVMAMVAVGAVVGQSQLESEKSVFQEQLNVKDRYVDQTKRVLGSLSLPTPYSGEYRLTLDYDIMPLEAEGEIRNPVVAHCNVEHWAGLTYRTSPDIDVVVGRNSAVGLNQMTVTFTRVAAQSIYFNCVNGEDASYAMVLRQAVVRTAQAGHVAVSSSSAAS